MASTSYLVLFSCLLAFLSFAACARVASWDLTTANPVTNSVFTATSTNGATAGTLGFSGLTPVNAAGWTFTGYPSTLDTNKFISFDVSPLAGQPLDFDKIDLYLDIAAGGPLDWKVDYSLDAAFGSVLGTVTFTGIQTGQNGYNQDINPSYRSEQTVYFRAYGYNATSASAIAGLVNGGNSADVGVVVEASKNVRVCSCGTTACLGNTQIFGQGDCKRLKDWCNSAVDNGYIRVSFANNAWNMQTFNDTNCFNSTSTVVSGSCDQCNALGMLVSCTNSCAVGGSGSPASRISSNSVARAIYSYAFGLNEEEQLLK